MIKSSVCLWLLGEGSNLALGLPVFGPQPPNSLGKFLWCQSSWQWTCFIASWSHPTGPGSMPSCLCKSSVPDFILAYLAKTHLKTLPCCSYCQLRRSCQKAFRKATPIWTASEQRLLQRTGLRREPPASRPERDASLEDWLSPQGKDLLTLKTDLTLPAFSAEP